MKPGEPSRRTALEAVLEYHSSGTYLDAALSAALEATSLDRRDRALVNEMVQGTVRMRGYLDWAIAHFSDREPASLDDTLLWVLRLAAYQVLLMDVPDHAACDIGVSLATERGGRGAGSYVNAVMRALVRGRGGLEFPDRDSGPVEYLEARYSMPRWICRLWVDEHGLHRAESLCAASNVQPPVSLRCNLRRARRQDVAAGLESAGAQVELGALAGEAILVRKGGSPALLPGFAEGLFAVQDQGSMMVGHAVGPEPGMRVLDMCAAPGGKANHMAELMGGSGEVVALDRDTGRLEMVSESAARLGNAIIRTVVMDAGTLHPGRFGMFERVLVDVPCSGLGTLARRADLRWRKEPSDVARLARVQSGLLEAASHVVEPRGLLVYSTCTICRVENESVARGFLEDHPEFALEPASCRETSDGFIRIMPDTERCDGMFVAVFRRLD